MTDQPESTQHAWPAPGEHLWGSWMPKTGFPKPTRYRQCVHPDCKAVDVQPAPIAPSA